MPEQRDPLPGSLSHSREHRRDIAELPFGGVVQTIRTGTEAAPVQGKAGDVVAELVDQRLERCVVTERAVN
jgi:hypothetical protein